MSGRDAYGRFAPGFSSDRWRGRQPTPSPIALHAAMRASVLMVANALTVISDANGRRRTVPLFEALLLRLATGQTSRRSSPINFLRLVIECAATEPAPANSEQAASLAVASAKEQLFARVLNGTGKTLDQAVADYMAVLHRA